MKSMSFTEVIELLFGLITVFFPDMTEEAQLMAQKLLQGFFASVVLIWVGIKVWQWFARSSVRLKRDRQQRITLAQQILRREEGSCEFRSFLQEQIEQEMFQRFCGIAAGPDMRAALNDFYRKHQNKIGWHDLTRAISYITLDEQSALKVRKPAKAGYWFVNLLVFLILLIAAVTFSGGIYAGISSSSVSFFMLLVVVILMMFGGLLFSSLNWPYQSALKIRKCIASEQAPPASHDPDQGQPTAAETEADTE